MAEADLSDCPARVDESIALLTSTSCAEILDPRIRRTRELLQQALANLLETRDFERISVQDITDNATVNRATFYAHYPDKFALLECLVGGRFEALLAARNVVIDGTCLGAIHGLVLGVCDYLDQTLKQPSRSVADRHLGPHLESAIVAVVRRMILGGISRQTTASGVSPAVLAATTSGAIYGAAREWATTPDHPPSEEFAPTVMRLIEPILHAAPVGVREVRSSR